MTLPKLSLLVLSLASACAPGPVPLRPLVSCPSPADTSVQAADSGVYDARVDSLRITRVPQLSQVPELRYPVQLYQAGIDGRVLVQVIISARGRAEPSSIRILMSTNALFEPDAIVWVRDAVFCPGVVGDRPVRVRIGIPVVFDSHAPLRT